MSEPIRKYSCKSKQFISSDKLCVPRTIEAAEEMTHAEIVSLFSECRYTIDKLATQLAEAIVSRQNAHREYISTQEVDMREWSIKVKILDRLSINI